MPGIPMMYPEEFLSIIAEKIFNFEKIQEAIIGSLVTLKNGPIIPDKKVAVSRS
jgi:hypothetical protein